VCCLPIDAEWNIGMLEKWKGGHENRVEKAQTARIKGIVSSSGYRSVSLDVVSQVCQILINIVSSIHRL
jgi:hypothetical protein